MILIWSKSLFAQQENKYPVEFGQFMQSTLLNNPAAITEHDYINFQTGLLQYIGPFKGIRTYYSTFSYQLQKKYIHEIGFNFIGDREGELISRNYFYGRYSIKIRLNDKYTLSTGSSLGFVNFAFSGSTPNSTGADTKIDGCIGTWLHHEKFNIGFAVNQVTNSSLKPIEETFILSPFYILNSDYEYKINPFHSLKVFMINRAYNHKLNSDLAILIKHYDTFTWGSGYKTSRGFTFYAGLNKIPVLDDRLHVLFSYFIPTFENQANRYNFLEINLAYGINSKQAK